MSLAFNVRPKVIPVLNKRVQLLYPVRRIYCFGKNYDAHAREMGGRVNKGLPLFFTKPTDTLIADYNNFSSPHVTYSMRYPPMTESYHHEVQLVVALGPSIDEKTSYSDVPVEEVSRIIYGYAVGLDMTRRDLQQQAMENKMPWDLSKGAEDGAGISTIIRTQDLRKSSPKLFTNTENDISSVVCQGEITLSVNGQMRQAGNMNCMINSVEELVSMLSKYVALQPGDLIYTGTPAGVSPVRRGDVLEAAIEGLGSIKSTIV